MAKEEIQHPAAENNEITLRELILLVREYMREIWRSWKMIAVICLLFSAYFLYQAITHHPTYDPKLTFMINKEEGSERIGLNNVLGQFGIGGVGKEHNLDKVLELLRSRRITEAVLFKKGTIHGKHDYMANHLINNLDSTGRWAHVKWYKRLFTPTPLLRGFQFSHDRLEDFKWLENSALNILHRRLVGVPDVAGSGLIKEDYSELTGIMHTGVTCTDETLGIELTNLFFEELSQYYIDKTTEKQKVTYELVKAKRDSLQGALDQAQYGLAQFLDRSRGIFKETSEVQGIKLRNKIAILTAAVAKSTENVEIADFALKNKTPYIQVIDRPLAPIKINRKSKVKALVSALLFGLIFSVVLIVLRKIFRDAMT